MPPINDPCEWNPDKGRPLAGDEQPHAQATLVVGRNGGWRLCEACSKLERFHRYVTFPIKRPRRQHAQPEP